jgi:hypothetical protein
MMKKIILAALFFVAAGCSPSAKNETTYLEFLQVYNTELEVLERMETQRERMIAGFEKSVDDLYDRENDTETASKKGDKLADEFKVKRLAYEQEIAAQQLRVDRAKAELDAAEAKR